MTKTQSEIIEMIARLPLAERRELVETIQERLLDDDPLYDRLTPEQRAHLQEGIEQADRGEGEHATAVFDRLAKRLGVATS
jgi:hypothetical protein